MRYMSQQLVRAGATVHVQKCDCLFRAPYLNRWFWASRAVVVLLTNGTQQVRNPVSLALPRFPAETICL
jgi:hypothetical protein